MLTMFKNVSSIMPIRSVFDLQQMLFERVLIEE
mgnify:CR=1 FL=1